MSNKKNIRTRGKVQMSKYFQEFEKGDRIAIVREPSVNSDFPKRMQGRSGVIEGKRGRAYLVKMRDSAKEKTYLIAPIHLKKIHQTK